MKLQQLLDELDNVVEQGSNDEKITKVSVINAITELVRDCRGDDMDFMFDDDDQRTLYLDWHQNEVGSYNETGSSGAECIEFLMKPARGNNYQTIGVTFSYRYWKNLTDEANKERPILDRIAESAVNTVTRRITSQIPSVLRRL